MGARIALDIVRALEGEKESRPLAFIVSAAPAPHLPPRWQGVCDFDREAIMNVLRTFGGIPEAALREPELLELIVPTVQADLELFETAPRVDPAPIATRLVALYGELDNTTPPDAVLEWRAHAGASFSSHGFPGGHFFLREHQAEVLDVVRAVFS